MRYLIDHLCLSLSLPNYLLQLDCSLSKWKCPGKVIFHSAHTTRFTDCLSTAYVDINLVKTEKVSQAAILGQQGGVWAISSGLEVIQPLRHLLVTHALAPY